LIRVILGVLIVAVAIVLGIVIIYRAFHAVHTAKANHPAFYLATANVSQGKRGRGLPNGRREFERD
jgi:hypothetical protein